VTRSVRTSAGDVPQQPNTSGAADVPGTASPSQNAIPPGRGDPGAAALPNQGHMAASAICDERPPRYATATGASPDALSEPPSWPRSEGSPRRSMRTLSEGGRPGSVVLEMKEWDTLLVARIAAGDDYALGELVDRFGGLLMGIARRISGSQSVAEDVLQEVVSDLWRHPERYSPERGSLRSYLGVQAQRRAVDSCRSEARRKARQGRWELLGWPGGCRALDDVDGSDLRETVRRAIARLPSEQRQAVELAYWRGRTHKEIALELKLPEGTVKSRLRLAQAKLADWLAPVGAGPW
jgi:RNA polymerase sigma factor (sigma-70 family)